MVDVVQVREAALVDVEHGHLGAQARRHAHRRGAHDPRADHRDPAARHAGYTAEQHPAAALVALQVVGADLHREPPRDLAHRHQERQRAVLELDRLVADRDDPAREDAAGQRRLGREVQEVEQGLARAHRRDLRRRGLLDLGDHVGAVDHLFGRLRDLRADGLVLLVGKTAALTRAGFESDLVACRDERSSARGEERDPHLAVLGFAQHADAHGSWLLWTGGPKIARAFSGSGGIGPCCRELLLGSVVVCRRGEGGAPLRWFAPKVRGGKGGAPLRRSHARSRAALSPTSLSRTGPCTLVPCG